MFYSALVVKNATIHCCSLYNIKEKKGSREEERIEKK
jgi:hypothetical protein